MSLRDLHYFQLKDDLELQYMKDLVTIRKELIDDAEKFGFVDIDILVKQPYDQLIGFSFESFNFYKFFEKSFNKIQFSKLLTKILNKKFCLNTALRIATDKNPFKLEVLDGILVDTDKNLMDRERLELFIREKYTELNEIYLLKFSSLYGRFEADKANLMKSRNVYH